MNLYGIALVLLLTLTSCYSKTTYNDMYGELTDTQYRNNFFGIELKLPEGWHAMKTEEGPRVISEGLKDLKSRSGNTDINETKVVANTLLLLDLSQLDPQEVKNSNPSVLLIAEKINPSVIRNSRQYVENSVANQKKYSGSILVNVSDPTERTISGKPFAHVVMNYRDKQGDWTTEVDASIEYSYALTVVSNYSTPAERSETSRVVNSLNFTKKEP